MKPITNILLISDAPSGSTGLGRVTRELATRIHQHLPEFRVATYGYGPPPDPRLPFPQFSVDRKSLQGAPNLPGVWSEFTGSESAPGILFSITNASWVPWLANPDTIEDKPEHQLLKSWLTKGVESGQLKRWLYFPVDADSVNLRMHPSQADIILGFDRYLAYGSWAAKVVDETCAGHPKWPGKPTEHLPHGTISTFHQRNRRSARHTFLHRLTNRYIGPTRPVGQLPPDALLLNSVATNTPRKVWPLAFEVTADLVLRGHDAYLWAHVDHPRAWWDLPTLIAEFDLSERVILTSGYLPDEQLAWLYSACDCTLGIGSSEGWGMPLAESLACGTPVVHGDYAGATEFVPPEMLIEPIAFAYEGFFANRRPIFKASRWTDRVLKLKSASTGTTFGLDPKFMWDGPDGCWEKWAQWLRSGL